MRFGQKPGVFLTGRDFVNWALDSEVRITETAISEFAEIVSTPENADVIHAVTWRSLLDIPASLLKSRTVIAGVPHDPKQLLGDSQYLKIADFVDLWITYGSKFLKDFEDLGLPVRFVPHGVDTSVFYPCPSEDYKRKLRQKYGLPQDAFLIGSFQRDTEGNDLVTPKYVKGPDILLEILHKAYLKDPSIIPVLSSPRRFWIRKQFEERKIPYLFIGSDVAAGSDDIDENTLPIETIRDLLQACDLYVIASRSEGGPKIAPELLGLKIPVLSTDVGLVRDTFPQDAIFGSVDEAVEKILKQKREKFLDSLMEVSFKNLDFFTEHGLRKAWQKIYREIDLEKKGRPSSWLGVKFKKITRFRFSAFRIWKKLGKLLILFRIHEGPYGGGNQFLKALKRNIPQESLTSFEQRHWGIRTATILVNSFFLPTVIPVWIRTAHKVFTGREWLLRSWFRLNFDFYKLGFRRIIHRIDGPTILVRGQDQELDDALFYFNERYADISVFQSMWSLKESVKLGYHPINPCLIYNAPDDAIFFKDKKQLGGITGKLKVISSSWSNNPRKGLEYYRWLDENLDWNLYEYTFVGNIDGVFKNIKLVPPVESVKLAEILRSHDVYLTASKDDPCSNAVAEALACGLPVVYLKSGGTPELVGWGGLGFDKPEEMISCLEKMRNDHDMFRRLVVPADIRAIARSYLDLHWL